MQVPPIDPQYNQSVQEFTAEGPQPLLREIPKGEPYPKEALGPLREVVEAVTDITKAPLAIAAQSALGVASLVIQAHADVETLGGSAPTSLYCLTIAESGERKSSCDRILMKGIRDYEESQESIYQSALQTYETDKEIWATKRKEIIGKKKDDKIQSAGTEADLRALGPAPRCPLYPKLTAQEPTFEGLLKLYQTGRPALGLFSDEAGGFIGGHAMNADNKLKTIAGLSQLWNGETVNRVRSGDGASSYVGRRLAVHLMAQPIAARPLLADPQATGQGFLARFLITEPPSLIGTRLGRGHSPKSDQALIAFNERLNQRLGKELPTASNPQELKPRTLALSDAAKNTLWAFYEEVEKAQAIGEEMEHIRSYASKSAEQAARIAGVLTLWENLEATSVSEQTMTWGITLARFYLGEAKRLAEAGLISEETGKAESLRKWLIESWPHDDVTPRDILRLGPNRLREMKAVTPAINTLITHGWLTQLPEGQKIRGSVRKTAYHITKI